MRNKSIAILTYHNANNYGAVLQTYALQYKLKSLFPGVDVQVVNYTCKGVEKQRSLKKMIKAQGLVSAVIHYPAAKTRIRKIDRFCKEHLNLTPPLNGENDLQEFADKCDYIISGSDQIWNKKWNGNDSTFLQGFHTVSAKKISYAASFGVPEIPADWIEEYKEKLSQFSALSVREESGLKILENMGLKGTINIDPTLLLPMSDWDKIADKPKIKQPYIFLFMVPYQSELVENAVELARANNLKIVIASKSLRWMSGKNVSGSSVEQIVGYFKHASIVVTNSFHGTAFALIYRKSMLLNLNNPRGYNLRSESLLRMCGIDVSDKSGRLFLDGSTCSWNDVEKLVSAQREYAEKYLIQSIGDYVK